LKLWHWLILICKWDLLQFWIFCIVTSLFHNAFMSQFQNYQRVILYSLSPPVGSYRADPGSLVARVGPLPGPSLPRQGLLWFYLSLGSLLHTPPPHSLRRCYPIWRKDVQVVRTRGISPFESRCPTTPEQGSRTRNRTRIKMLGCLVWILAVTVFHHIVPSPPNGTICGSAENTCIISSCCSVRGLNACVISTCRAVRGLDTCVISTCRAVRGLNTCVIFTCRSITP
jgi:hypothetical protein